MLQSLATRKQVKLVEKKLKATAEKSFGAFQAAIKTHRSELIKMGVIDKYTGEIDFKKLKLALKKDKAFASKFYSTVAENSGLTGDKIIVGKAITNMSIRAGLAAKGVGGKGLSAVTAVEIARLNNLGNHLAEKFGGGSFSAFITRYTTDKKFRGAVNDYITKIINQDSTLAGLKGHKPEDIVSGITAVKAATMSRTDIIKDAFKPASKQSMKHLAAHAGMAAMTLGSMFIIQASVLPLSANPQLSQSMHMAYYGTMEALRTANRTLSPFLRNAMRQAQIMQQEQQMNG